ncbi:hypothetical protein [Massilia sp. DWR3-1-1]|uniref:nSTAND1 domain-containing NTPase n=1 Tax=Massilia sp. DWR3-1-1 TaxID=2804559 RepID=UPI003CEC0E01
MITPYVGPTPLNDQHVLFGRDEEVEELAWRVIAHRIIVLYSASGAGKSSLLFAKNGLLAQLQHRFHVLPTIRLGGRCERDPVRTSLQQLAPAHGAAADQDTLLAYFERITIPEHAPPKRLLLVIDQFEEIFSNGASRAEQLTFFQQLGTLLAREHSPVWAILSMREEYFSWLDEFRELVPTRLHNTFRLNLLSKDQAIAAIKGPAQAIGVRFPEEQGGDAATVLAGALSEVRVRGRDGRIETRQGDRIEAVQLQVICLDLWKKLSMGGRPVDAIRIADVMDYDPDKALRQYCDNALSKAAVGRRRAKLLRDWIDLRLLSPSGMRLPAMLDPQEKHSPSDEEMDVLQECHLIRRQTREDGAWYELSHDSLALPVRRSIERWRMENLEPWQKWARAWQLGGGRDRYFRTLSGRQLQQIPTRGDRAHDTDNDLAFLEAVAGYRQQQGKTKIFIASLTCLAIVLAYIFWKNISKEAALVLERNTTAVQAGVLAILSEKPGIALGARAAVTGTTLQKENPHAVAFNFRSLLSDYLNANRNLVAVEAEETGLATASDVNGQYRVIAAIGRDHHAVEVRERRAHGSTWQIDPNALRQAHPDGVRLVALLDHGLLATGDDGGAIQLWRIATRTREGDRLRLPSDDPGKPSRMGLVSFAVSGEYLLASYAFGMVAAWRVPASGPVPATPAWRHGQFNRQPVLTAWDGGRQLAVIDAADNRNILLITALDGQAQLSELASVAPTGQDGAIYESVAVSGDGRLLAAGNRAGTIDLWDIASKSLLRRINAHAQTVTQLKFFGKDQLLSTGGDGHLKRWSLPADQTDQASGSTVFTFRRKLSGMAVDPEHKEVLVSTDKGDVLTVSLEENRHAFGRVVAGAASYAYLPKKSGRAQAMPAQLGPDQGAMPPSSDRALARTPLAGMARAESIDTTFLARAADIVAVPDGGAKGGPTTVVHTDYTNIDSIHVDDKGTLLVIRVARATALWSLPRPGSAAGACEIKRNLPNSFPSRGTAAVAFHPAKGDFVTVAKTGELQYWHATDSASGCATISELPARLGDAHRAVRAATFDASGNRLWIAERDGRIHGIDLANDLPKKIAPIQEEAATPPTVLAAGRNDLAVGNERGELYVFQPGSRFPVRIAQDFHHAPITALALSEDGRWLISSSAEGTMTWDLDIRTWTDRACVLARQRSFSQSETDHYFERVSDKPTPCVPSD